MQRYGDSQAVKSWSCCFSSVLPTLAGAYVFWFTPCVALGGARWGGSACKGHISWCPKSAL